MKKALFVCIIIILAMVSCTERKFDNPLDPVLIDDNLIPPDNFQIMVVDEDVLELTWEDKCDIEDSFQIYRKVGKKDYALIKTVPANSTAWQDNSVELGNTYSYKIYAVNDDYRSLNATEFSFDYNLRPPTNFKLEALSDTRFKLSWHDTNHFEQGYKLDRQTGDSEWQENFATLPENARSWEYVINEPEIPVYSWRIRAYYKSQHSGYSSETSLKVSDPVFSVAGGTYNTNQSVTISCATQGAQIRYTTNGSTPTSSSALYSYAISISAPTALRAKAFKNGWTDSETTSANYILKVATPTFNLAGGTYLPPQSVAINCATNGATIRYTTNGDTPTSSSTLYSDAIQINTDTTLKAKAFKSSWTDSEITFSSYIFDMILVPGGTFIMGDTRGVGYNNELPTHSVTLNSFYISKYHVTQGEYETTVGHNPASYPGVGSNYPVYSVNWYDAIKYCNLRSIDEGLTPVYSISGSTNPDDWGIVPNWNNTTWNAAVCNWNANGYRLPTEAEWEYAARGATNNPDYLYSGSDNIDDVAWYRDNSGENTHPVEGKAPNGLGIYDMSGNVREWCWDWYGSSYYSSSPSNNPRGPASGTSRLFRGGSWFSYADRCRVTYRGSYSYPNNRDYNHGFRVVRAIK